MNIAGNILFYILSKSLLGYSHDGRLILAGLAGRGTGIIGLFVVNYYLNIIPDKTSNQPERSTSSWLKILTFLQFGTIMEPLRRY